MKHIRPSPARVRGFTLVELMVSLIIASLIALAAVASIWGMRVSSETSERVASLDRSAITAFNILEGTISQAGYIPIDVEEGINGIFNVLSNRNTNLAGEPQFFALRGLEGGAGANDEITVGYAPTVDSYTDCLGQKVANYDENNPYQPSNVRLITNRFYVNANKDLLCDGSGGVMAQPIVSGVERFDVRYVVESGTGGSAAFQHRNASQVSDFKKVVGVQMCLEITTRNLSNIQQSYTDCDGVAQTATDGNQHGVFKKTVQIRNMGVLL